MQIFSPVSQFTGCLAVPCSHIGALQIIFLSLVHGEGDAYPCLGMPDDPTPPVERHYRLQKSWHAVCMGHPVILLKTFMVNTSVLQDPRQWVPGWHTLAHTGFTPQGDIHLPKAECIMSLAEVTSLWGMPRGCIYCCFCSGPADPAHSVQVCDLITGFKKHLIISSLLKQMEEETKPAGMAGKFCLMVTLKAHLHSTHTFLLQIILNNVETIQSNSKTPQ